MKFMGVFLHGSSVCSLNVPLYYKLPSCSLPCMPVSRLSRGRVKDLHCKKKKNLCHPVGFTLHWDTTLRAGDKTHAYWLEAAGRKKKPYVPSDVIKAKNYLFSLCIHGEIVSTGGTNLCIIAGTFVWSGAFEAGILNGMSLSGCIQRGFKQI